MLQIMDEGRLTDGKSKTVSFRDVIVIMTSNLGVKEVNAIKKKIGFGNVTEVTKHKADSAISQALRKHFKPEFLNRLTCTINFNKLTKKDYIKIIKLELIKLRNNLKLNKTKYSKLNLVFDKSVYSYIYDKGIDEEYGARPLLRAIERYISTPLAKRLLKEGDRKWSNVEAKVYIEDNDVKISLRSLTKDHDDPPFYMEASDD